MARTVRDTKLETRAARRKLKAQRAPYWRAVDRGAHLGYRKGKTGGFWVARFRLPVRKYAFKSIGVADDIQDADGGHFLDFFQAQERSRIWFDEQRRKEDTGTIKGRYTVSDAMREYLEWFDAQRRSFNVTKSAADALILPDLGRTEVSKLTTRRIRKWHEGLANTPARLRTARGKEQQYREPPDDRETQRKRRSTANRVLTILKAALNHAYREDQVGSDHAWRKVRPFKSVDAPKIGYLNEQEIVRLVNACRSDFRQLVRAALLTGCRYGELTGLRCGDFNPDAGSVYVHQTKAGKPRHAVLTDEGYAFFQQITTGRHKDEIMFLRTDGKPWGRAHQMRPLKEACKGASLSPPISFHILRHTYASQLAMRGVPMGVIAAQLGHSDTRMAEKHYAQLAPSYVADTIRANFPRLGILESSKVVNLKPGST